MTTPQPVPAELDPFSPLDLFKEEFGVGFSVASVSALAAVWQATRHVIDETPTGLHRHREEQQRIWENALRELAEAVNAMETLTMPGPDEDPEARAMQAGLAKLKEAME